ncbi:hypothetical protein QBC39DRAFT_49103 [Podospora conica]|nr:hypothetical protein QBC39DRAFT_49103 [Schizothecium conicum]
MPPTKPRVQGAAGPVNTLGGTDSHTRPPKRAQITFPVDPQGSKRPKHAGHTYTESRLALNLISQPISRPQSSFGGSQDGYSSLMSTGMSLDTTGQEPSRSNRRRRNPNHPPTLMGAGSPPLLIPPGRDDIEDGQDELSNETTPFIWRNRTAPPMAKPKADERIGADGADLEIIAPKSGANISKKRAKVVDLDDDDELGDYHQTKKAAVGKKAREMPARKSVNTSLSTRADLASTSWSKKPEGHVRARLISAVCPQRHVYSVNEDQSLDSDEDSQLYLQRGGDDDPNLYACTANGQQAVQSRWLKINKSTVKSVLHDPSGPYIKVLQMLDGKEEIGGALVLKFADKDDASEVANWVKTELKLLVSHCTADSLAKTHQNFWDIVVKFNEKTPPKNPTAPPSTASQTPIVLTHAANGLGFRRTPPEMATPRPQPIKDRMQGVAHNPAYNPLEMAAPRTQTIKDRMQGATRNSAHNTAEHIPEPPSTRRSTRSCANSRIPIQVEDNEPEPEPEVARWSHHNTDWQANWKVPLVFQRTTVDKEDIQRLDDPECLNDNLIGFGMRFLFDQYAKKDKSLNQRVYLHNTFFYTTLKTGRSYQNINYDGVKSWTSKVDLLSYDYVIVPVNEHFHWWLAIICNPGKLDRDARESSTDDVEDSGQTPQVGSDAATGTGDHGPASDLEMADATNDATDQHPLPSGGSPAADVTPSTVEGPKNEEDIRNAPEAPGAESDVIDLVDIEPVVSDLAASDRKPTKRGRKSTGPPPRVYDIKDPRIITLDSLGGSHSPAVGCLKSYLVKEFEHKRKKVLTDIPQQMGMKAVGLPEQDNFNDCGVYLLAYFQEFVKNPDEFIKKLLHREKVDWPMDPTEFRSALRDTIFTEQQKHQDSLVRGKAAKNGTARTPSKSPGGTTTSSLIKNSEPTPRPAAPPAQKSPVASKPQEPPMTQPAPPPARSPGQSSRTLRPSSSPANVPGAWPDNDGDEVMLLQPAKDVVLASVEPAPPPPVAPTAVERETLLQRLPDSSPPPQALLNKIPDTPPAPRGIMQSLRPSPMAKREQQPKPATIATPRTSHRLAVVLPSSSNKLAAAARLSASQPVLSRPQTRSLQNSPASTVQPKSTVGMQKSPASMSQPKSSATGMQKSPASMSQPKSTMRSTMRMPKSPYFSTNIPVAQNIRMVESSDDEDDGRAGKSQAIDLTEEEEEPVEARKKKDNSIDLTMD